MASLPGHETSERGNQPESQVRATRVALDLPFSFPVVSRAREKCRLPKSYNETISVLYDFFRDDKLFG